MKKIKYIEQWLMTMLAVVLLAACSRSDSDEISSSEEGDCYIEFYVYQPDRPMVTRATDEAVIAPTDGESKIHSLKIWVFRHSDASNHAPLGYLEVDETTDDETTDDNTTDDNTTDDKKAGKTLLDIMNKEGQQMFKMKVPAEFADHPQNVDVYVVANEGGSGVSLGGNSTREEIKAAKITSSFFGVCPDYNATDATAVKKVPDTGLPMSAMLENQPIYGSFPTLRIGNADQIATLRLTRAVSKLRFVICRKTEDLYNDKRILKSITSIKLNASMIPTESYLIPVPASSYGSSDFVDNDAMNYGGIEKTTIPEVEDPLVYAYTPQENEEQALKNYEDLINKWATEIKEGKTTPDLYQFGITYLRESPKDLTGTIEYIITENSTTTDKTTTFSMVFPGEFMRNHSWIIYIYFMDEKLHVLTVTDLGLKDWTDSGSQDHSVYNW